MRTDTTRNRRGTIKWFRDASIIATLLLLPVACHWGGKTAAPQADEPAAAPATQSAAASPATPPPEPASPASAPPADERPAADAVAPEDQEHILQALNEFKDAWAAGDLPRLMECFSADFRRRDDGATKADTETQIKGSGVMKFATVSLKDLVLLPVDANKVMASPVVIQAPSFVVARNEIVVAKEEAGWKIVDSVIIDKDLPDVDDAFDPTEIVGLQY